MSYPTSPSFQAVNMKANSPTLHNETVSGRVQTRKIGTTKWSFSASYPVMTRVEFGPVDGFIAAQEGRHGVFTIVPPVVGSTQGSATGVITCASTSAGAKVVAVAGLTGDLKAADFVKFSGHSKVYKLTADRSGDGNLAFVPALVSAVSAADTLIYTDVPFTVSLSNDVQSFKVGLGDLFSYEVDVVEVI